MKEGVGADLLAIGTHDLTKTGQFENVAPIAIFGAIRWGPVRSYQCQGLSFPHCNDGTAEVWQGGGLSADVIPDYSSMLYLMNERNPYMLNFLTLLVKILSGGIDKLWV